MLGLEAEGLKALLNPAKAKTVAFRLTTTAGIDCITGTADLQLAIHKRIIVDAGLNHTVANDIANRIKSLRAEAHTASVFVRCVIAMLNNTKSGRRLRRSDTLRRTMTGDITSPSCQHRQVPPYAPHVRTS
ncbi:MAG TPA: hypothetical protein VF503_21560 [Sphingobium sp.]|uniref:hypothetical protein n=1 Tax=Sphingobium sp. TaxID=1912891 RepID=UPI002ED646F0